MERIDIAIIGAQKSGTSQLLSLLSQHPDLVPHGTPEFSHFVQPGVVEVNIEEAIRQEWPEKTGAGQKLLMKSSTLMFQPESIQLLHAHNPQVLAIVVLRNPVDRAYSAYWYARRKGWEPRQSFEEALDGPATSSRGPTAKRNTDYIGNGEYLRHIEACIEIFGRERLNVIKFEDLVSNPKSTCYDIFKAAEVSQAVLDSSISHRNSAALPRFPHIVSLVQHPSAPVRIAAKIVPRRWRRRLQESTIQKLEEPFTPPPMAPETRGKLNAYYRPFNAALAKKLDLDLSGWG